MKRFLVYLHGRLVFEAATWDELNTKIDTNVKLRTKSNGFKVGKSVKHINYDDNDLHGSDYTVVDQQPE